MRSRSLTYWMDLPSSPGLPWPEEPREDMEDGTKKGVLLSGLVVY